MIAWLLASRAEAGEHLVLQGQTVEDIAAIHGTTPEIVRAMNAIAGGAEPGIGAILVVPDPPGAGPIPAIVANLVGSVRTTDPRGYPVKVELGSTLPAGTTLCTADGYATLRVAVAPDGTHDDLYLTRGTCIRVRAATATSGSRSARVTLEQGSVSVRDAESPGLVVVDTASGVAAGDGGGFRVHVEGSGSTRTEALHAPVQLFGGGVQQAVEPGFGSRVRLGEAPSAPTPLLGPGTPSAPSEGASLRAASFAWTEVPRALGYRVELSTAADFSELVWSEDVSGTAWLPELLFLPTRAPGLWWRVASFDRTGFLGPPSDARSLTYPSSGG
ncbi:MAG: hypothetical protein H6738_23520 [Alphaproteobacteria bacterium]|nr:hypothetical protein [Alphaproteobacteria bacterium]